MNVVKEGQRWRERDGRFNRIVVIVAINDESGKAAIRTMDADGTGVQGRMTWASLSRFNGRSGGYEFVREAI